MENPSGFYVYVLIDPSGEFNSFPGLPFYVGKGKGGRAWTHLKGYKSAGGNPIKEARIKGIRNAGYEPFVHIHSIFDSEAEALECEANLIKELGRRNNQTGILANLSDGGDGGTAGIPCSDEKKAAISKANTGKTRSSEYCENLSKRMKGSIPWNKGNPLSEEYRQKLSKAHTGKTQTPESNLKRSQTLKGRNRPQEVVAKILATKKEKESSMDPSILKFRRSNAAKKAWETKRKNGKK